MIVNWIKYNFINSRNTIMCINKELNEVKNKEFVDKFYKMCEKLGYPLGEIFKDVDGFQEEIRGLQGVCMPLGEEEIKEEVKEEIEEIEEVEEIKKEIKKEIKEEVVEEEKEKLKNQLISADEADKTSEMAEVVQVFNNNIHPITPIEFEKLRDWSKDISCDAVILAIEEAVQHNARTMSYINSVLNNWYSLGLTTGKAVMAYQRDWKDKNKDCKSSFQGANSEAYQYVE